MVGRPITMNDPNANLGGAWQPQHLVGRILAERYQVQKLLGEGGMGSVFLAEHVTLRKRVAIKVLHHELCRDQTQVDRFLQEARAASMIGHEHIVDIVDFGSVPGGSVFFAMEYLEGTDLAELLKRERRLPWARARELMLQIVRALAAAHNKGIIHRDLKPANCFLVKRSDGRDFVKLLDFGIAKVTDPESGSGSGLTRTGAVFGTAKYMAPEQAIGDPADQRSDIYAAAICLYEFLTGQVPYDGDNFMRVLSRHLTEPLTLPTTVAPDANITPPVEALIVKALSKKPDDRYRSMEEVEQALLSIGPDGHLAGYGLNMGYPGGGPQVEPTMWLGQAPGGNRSPSRPPSRPPSHPPSRPPSAPPWNSSGGEGTMVLDTGGGYASRPPTSNRSGSPTSPGVPTRPPSHATHPGMGGESDVTTFPAERSYFKLGLVIALAGAFAVASGGFAAWWFLKASFEDDEPSVVADARKTVSPTEAPAIESPKEPPAKDPVETSAPSVATPPEKAIEPPVANNPSPVNEEPVSPPSVNTAEGDPTEVIVVEEPEIKPAATVPSPSGTRRPKGNGARNASPKDESPTRPSNTNKPDPTPPAPPTPAAIKDSRSPMDIQKGFQKAVGAVQACEGGLPGMRITIRATITSSGKVLQATPRNNGSLPVAKCAANAVRSNADFVEVKQGLEAQDWTFNF